MKKYIMPAVEIADLEAEKMISLSMQGGAADDSEVLSREEDIDVATEESPYEW